MSLNADVTVAAPDRAGLERLLRDCARPVFASERLQWIETDQRLVYRRPKPKSEAQTVLCLTPLEFWQISSQCRSRHRAHRHRYYGVLAPHAPLRPAVTVLAGLPVNAEVSNIDPSPVTAEDLSEIESGKTAAAASLWAMLITRIYEILPLVCPRRGGELKIIAFLARRPIPFGVF